jgi:hypothetical protein
MKYINYIIILSIIIIMYISYYKYEVFTNNLDYVKFIRGIECNTNYKLKNNSSLEQCKNLCNNSFNCKIFSFSSTTNNCKYSFCNENSNNIKCRRDNQCDIVDTQNNNLFVNKQFKNNYIQNQLDIIHKKYNLDNDVIVSKKKWMNKLKMQMLIYQYLSKDSIVLEINSGIGELSIVINSILENPNGHFVTEISKKHFEVLKKNKERNDMKYYTFYGTVSNNRVITKKNFNGVNIIRKISGNESIIEDWEEIPKITLTKINERFETIGKKINTIIIKDTNNLLIDLLRDNINEINNIKTIIIENNLDIIDKKELDKFLIEKGYINQLCIPDFSKDKNDYDYKCYYSVWKIII